MRSKMFAFLILLTLLLPLSSFSQELLLLYGGPNHDVFLGELNSDQMSLNSIWNFWHFFS